MLDTQFAAQTSIATELMDFFRLFNTYIMFDELSNSNQLYPQKSASPFHNFWNCSRNNCFWSAQMKVCVSFIILLSYIQTMSTIFVFQISICHRTSYSIY